MIARNGELHCFYVVSCWLILVNDCELMVERWVLLVVMIMLVMVLNGSGGWLVFSHALLYDAKTGRNTLANHDRIGIHHTKRFVRKPMLSRHTFNGT